MFDSWKANNMKYMKYVTSPVWTQRHESMASRNIQKPWLGQVWRSMDFCCSGPESQGKGFCIGGARLREQSTRSTQLENLARLRGDNYDGALTAICCISDALEQCLMSNCSPGSSMGFSRHGFIGKRGICQHLRRQFPKEYLPERGFLALQPQPAGFFGGFKFPKGGFL